VLSSEGKQLKVLLFDLGFTLINFDGNFNKALQVSYGVLTDALLKMGCQVDKEKFSAKFTETISDYYRSRDTNLIEKPIEETLRKTLAYFSIDHLTESDLQRAVEAMYHYTESLWKIEPDAHQVLERLKELGYRMAVISNASNTPDLNRLIDNNGLRKYFEIVVISAEEGIRKPDPRIFVNTINKLGVKPENVVMIGDTLNADILGAQKAGIRSVWITRRADRPENKGVDEKIKPDYVVPDLASLIDVIEQMQ
jgi:HAD superfamily hydrolase (TIGR01549 family)